jgi:hypothetical protein
LTAAALPRGEEDFAELMALGSEENSAGMFGLGMRGDNVYDTIICTHETA